VRKRRARRSVVVGAVAVRLEAGLAPDPALEVGVQVSDFGAAGLPLKPPVDRESVRIEAKRGGELVVCWGRGEAVDVRG
jgi:hypothetical protein